MKKIILKQFGVELGHAIVEDDKAQEQAAIFLDNYKGLPQRWTLGKIGFENQVLEEKKVIEQEYVAAIPEVMDDQGNIVQAAVPEVPEVSHMEYFLEAEYTIEIQDVTAQVNQAKQNEEALKYLAETDWYIIREMDSGVQCPTGIKQARSEARNKIVR